MNYKKTVLGAASVLALLAGTTAPAGAAIDPGRDPAASAQQADPLFAFIASAQGGNDVESAINELFGNASKEQIERFPEFLSGVYGLGLSADAVQRTREALIEIASSSSELDESTRQLVVAAVEEERCTAELAAEGKCRAREPETTGSNGREPDTTGSIGAGASGGVYQ